MFQNFYLFSKHLLLTWVVLYLFLSGNPASAAQSQAEFNIKGGRVKKDNIFNIFFGRVPLMPTETGTIIIDAFWDKNGNGQRDEGEPSLDKGVVCVLDEIEYPVPAFIPGLENGMNYLLECSGVHLSESVKKKNIFIKRRGQIIKVDLPCRPPQPFQASSHPE